MNRRKFINKSLLCIGIILIVPKIGFGKVDDEKIKLRKIWKTTFDGETKKYVRTKMQHLKKGDSFAISFENGAREFRAGTRPFINSDGIWTIRCVETKMNI